MATGNAWLRYRLLGVACAALVFQACGDGADECGGIVPASRSVELKPAELTLDVGGQSTIGAAIGGECVDGRTSVRYESSDVRVATVTSGGAVTGVGAGSANITATSTDFGVSGIVRVTVRPAAVQTLLVSSTALSVRERRSGVVRAIVETTGGLSRSVRFSSSAPAVASITVIDSLSASITGVSPGTADIEIVSDADATKRATVRVIVEPALVAVVAIAGVTPTDSVLLASTRRLTAAVSDSAGFQLSDRPVSWTSSNVAIATVSPTGEIRAIGNGTTSISASVPVGDGSGVRTAGVSVRVFGILQVAVSPSTAAVAEGQTAALAVSVNGTAGISRGVQWESSNAARATVSQSGIVTGLLAGVAPVVIRARSVALSGVVDSSFVTVQSGSVPTTIEVRPESDTLSPQGTRVFSAAVRDQRNGIVAAAPVVWRSLTPSLAAVSPSGVVTALGNGVALIAAATPRSTSTDSLRDTSSILIVPPCSLVRPVAFGATYNGAFDASSCRNFIGFPTAAQFSLTSSTQRSYAIRLTPTFVASLVPLAIGSGFFGLPSADTTVVGLGVMRAGTFSFFVTAPSSTAVGSYSVTVTENPNPALFCVPTDVTRGVAFDTAMLPNTCQSRDIRILPALSDGVSINITATAQAFPVQIELREFGTNTLLRSALAVASGATARISFVNQGFRFSYVRVLGPNGTVRLTID